MVKILSNTDAEEWREIVHSFSDYDVYYLGGYMKAFQMHGDGEPILVYAENEGLRGMCVYMKRDVCSERRLKGIQPNTYFDIVTPYGYGGFIWDGNCSQANIEKAIAQVRGELLNRNIVCEFVRWHPMLQNADAVRGVEDVIDLGHTIHMDLSSKEIIWNNITSKNRNTIRSAVKKGVVIGHSDDSSLFESFRQIYNKTMEKDGAEEYYFFEPEFYESIVRDLAGHYELFYAQLEGKIISVAIMLFANGKMHYHLSGSLTEYRNCNSSNLLLYEAACWGCEQGFKTFHMGGGVGSGEDNLFKFKQAFNRNSRNQFSISKIVYDREKYDYLVKNRLNNDLAFNPESKYFPLYRS